MTEITKKYDIIIIGAGAAGLICGATAAAREKQVLILEKAYKPGGKIPISGGGKCNFSNIDCSAENFYCNNKHFVKSALARYSQWDIIDLLDSNDIKWEQRDYGRLFCTGSALDIVKILIKKCEEANVDIQCDFPVDSVIFNDGIYTVTSAASQSFTAEKVVVSAGSPAWPQCGATNTGYTIARKFGLEVIKPKPALVPLMYNETDLEHMEDLAGNSVIAAVSCNNSTFIEDVLFTHTGLSGPAILQISNTWQQGDTIAIDWLNGYDLANIINITRQTDGAMTIAKLLHKNLPQRFINLWQQRYFPDCTGPIASLSKQQIITIADSINKWQFTPRSDAGFNKAEAAFGGICTKQISSKTMEVNTVPGLYFIGEVLDVTGQLGGYNLQWAWSSGYCCGMEI